MTTKSNRTEFGLRVLRARKWAGMTQAELAEVVGCRQTNIAEAERRSDDPAQSDSVAPDIGYLMGGKADLSNLAKRHQPRQAQLLNIIG